MGEAKTRRRAARENDRGEAWAKIVSFRSKYYISGSDVVDEGHIGDEAELEIVASIDAISPTKRKHLGQEMVVSLLSAQNYSTGEGPTAFFGSVTLRGSQRSALAYMPSAPFWALPMMIRGRDVWICVGWTMMRRGWAHLASLFIGDGADREHLLTLGGETLVGQK